MERATLPLKNNADFNGHAFRANSCSSRLARGCKPGIRPSFIPGSRQKSLAAGTQPGGWAPVTTLRKMKKASSMRAVLQTNSRKSGDLWCDPEIGGGSSAGGFALSWGPCRAFDTASSFRTALLVLGALLLLVLTGGCTTAGAPYAPETSFTARDDLDALKKKFATATAIEAYYSTAETKERRNAFIAGRLVLYDLAYADWISRFRFGRAAESTILDTASLGVTQAITILGGVETKEALGAIGAAILGTRSSYEKNFYDEQAASAITAQMNAERKAALIPIMAGTKANIDQYPLTAALIDLTNYQYAGTIDGALAGIHREAGIKEAAAQTQIDRFRNVSYVSDDATDRLLKWVYPGMANWDATGVVRDSAGAPVAKNAERVAAIEAELEKLGLDGLAIGALLFSGDLSAVRAKIVSNLQVP